MDGRVEDGVRDLSCLVILNPFSMHRHTFTTEFPISAEAKEVYARHLRAALLEAEGHRVMADEHRQIAAEFRGVPMHRDHTRRSNVALAALILLALAIGAAVKVGHG